MKTANRSTDRAHFKTRRHLALKRRAESAYRLLEKLSPYLTLPTLSFFSLPEEVDMSLVNRYLFEKELLILPRIEEGQLALHKVECWDFSPNKWGICEPPKNTPSASPSLILVPGLAFDLEGNRIGYGGGYYDRLLERLALPTIGVAFQEQLYAALETAPHDQRVDSVITV